MKDTLDLKKIYKCRPNTWHYQRWHLKKSPTRTISTVSTQDLQPDTTRYQTSQLQIFHTQSILFLFGFIFFPCWWIGSVGVGMGPRIDPERHLIPVEPSLLANGKTCQRYVWPSSGLVQHEVYYFQEGFYRWNRILSVLSIPALIALVALIIICFS